MGLGRTGRQSLIEPHDFAEQVGRPPSSLSLRTDRFDRDSGLCCRSGSEHPRALGYHTTALIVLSSCTLRESSSTVLTDLCFWVCQSPAARHCVARHSSDCSCRHFWGPWGSSFARALGSSPPRNRARFQAQPGPAFPAVLAAAASKRPLPRGCGASSLRTFAWPSRGLPSAAFGRRGFVAVRAWQPLLSCAARPRPSVLTSLLCWPGSLRATRPRNCEPNFACHRRCYSKR